MVFPDFYFKAGITVPFMLFCHLKMVAHAQLSLALLNRKEAEYWNALYLHHCVSIAYLLDLFPLSCNLAFALSLLPPSPRTRLAYCPCSHPLTTKGEITTRHRASKCLFEVFRYVREIFLFLLWVRHLYRQHFIFKETVIKIKRLNKLKNDHCYQYSSEWPVDTSLPQRAHLWSASIAVVLALFCLPLWSSLPLSYQV